MHSHRHSGELAPKPTPVKHRQGQGQSFLFRFAHVRVHCVNWSIRIRKATSFSESNDRHCMLDQYLVPRGNVIDALLTSESHCKYLSLPSSNRTGASYQLRKRST
jgi:hypothetical protein